jgi:Zn-dependent protease
MRRGFGRIGRLAGIDVFLHWSVVALVAILFLTVSTRDLGAKVFLVAAVIGVMVLHELGHALAARRLRYRVHSIEIYPFVGLTSHDAPASLADKGLIAWAGVLAQLAVAAPLIAYTAVFGFTPYGVVNAVIGVFGYFSLAIAVFNLLPARGLDGATAWRALPAIWRERRILRLKRRDRPRSWSDPPQPPDGEAAGSTDASRTRSRPSSKTTARTP